MDHLSTQISRKTRVSRGSYTGAERNSLSLLVFILSVVIMLAHCVPMSQRQETMPNQPETRTYKARLDVIREAVKRVLKERKFVLDTEQSNSLYLQTDWLEDYRHRSMAKVNIKPLERNKTEVKLHLLVQKRGVFGKDWEPENKIGVDVYRGFFDDVEMESYRVLYDGP